MAKNQGRAARNGVLNNPNYLLFFIVLLAACVFSNTLKNGFIDNWDDNSYILENEIIKQVHWENIKIMFSSFSQSNYHPFTILSYALEYRLFGQNPFYFHLTNYLLHLLNIILVYVFLKRFTGKTEVAVIASLFFAIHPMHVESVAWISERKDLLYTAFFLLSLISYDNYLKTEKKYPHLLVSILWFLCSCMSKPAAVCLPIVLMLMDHYCHKTISWKSLILKVPFFAFALFFGILALLSQSRGAIQDIASIFTILDRIFIISYSILYYLFGAFFPIHLSALHFYPIKSEGALPLQYYLALPTLFLVVWGIIKSSRFKKELTFGLLFYLITIAMVLQLIPVGRAIVSERYSYVSYIGIFFIFGEFYSYVNEKLFYFSDKIRPALSLILVFLVVFYSSLTYQRNKIWKNGIVLFSDVIKQYPEEGFGWSTRAYSKNINGDLNGSIADYSRAITLNAQNPELYFNRGNVYMAQGKFDSANTDYSRAIQIDPGYSEAYVNRGLSLSQLKRFDEALKDYDVSIALKPKDMDAHFNRGNLLYELGKFEKAIVEYTMVIGSSPGYKKAYYNRGVAKYNLNDKKGACTDWLNAEKLGHPEAKTLIETYCK